MPIVMVTEDEEAIQQYGSETEGVFVISFKVLPSVVSISVSVCVLCSVVVVEKRENKEWRKTSTNEFQVFVSLQLSNLDFSKFGQTPCDWRTPSI